MDMRIDLTDLGRVQEVVTVLVQYDPGNLIQRLDLGITRASEKRGLPA